MIRPAAGQLDLDRFERLVEEAGAAEPGEAAEKLREALALWRGPALADFAYEPFAQAAIGRREEVHLLAVEMGSTPTLLSDGTPRSSRSSMRWRPSTPFASACAAS